MQPAIIAFHLPQFHAIPENDHWWGTGYTEWTRVRAAKPLFSSHYQPRRPQDSRYYNLLDPATLAWQQSLAARHGISAFCYYHYWFKGIRLLEKPIELILRSPDLSLPLCLCWANEPWTRSWDGKSNQILINQDYGDRQDWIRHIEALLPVLGDARYLRHEGRPVFLIYRSHAIDRLPEMLDIWNDRLSIAGLPELYLLSMNTSFGWETRNRLTEGSVDFEPMLTLGHHMPLIHAIRRSSRTAAFLASRAMFGKPLFVRRRLSYAEVWLQILQRPPEAKRMLCAFVDWDNTPRKGHTGLVFEGATPQSFAHYFSRQFSRAMLAGHPFLFVNAWNEWSEGTYLEPDERFGTGYLSAILDCISDAYNSQ